MGDHLQMHTRMHARAHMHTLRLHIHAYHTHLICLWLVTDGRTAASMRVNAPPTITGVENSRMTTVNLETVSSSQAMGGGFTIFHVAPQACPLYASQTVRQKYY